MNVEAQLIVPQDVEITFELFPVRSVRRARALEIAESIALVRHALNVHSYSSEEDDDAQR